MNCTYNFDNFCYDNTINYSSYLLGSFVFFGILSIPICCALKYCESIKKNKDEQIILIPGYVHTEPTNIDSPPAYKDNINPERIV
jgi:hypothetical protein